MCEEHEEIDAVMWLIDAHESNEDTKLTYYNLASGIGFANPKLGVGNSTSPSSDILAVASNSTQPHAVVRLIAIRRLGLRTVRVLIVIQNLFRHQLARTVVKHKID